MNLQNLDLLELNSHEAKITNGGAILELVIAGSVMMMWAFDKGVEYGKSLAH